MNSILIIIGFIAFGVGTYSLGWIYGFVAGFTDAAGNKIQHKIDEI
jgi:hypothetical protein